MEAALITTYRCVNRCQMCGIWKYPTQREEEFRPALLLKLPDLDFVNVTGGEPFLRDDIEEIVHILKKRARRIVISTNGYFTDKIIRLTEKHKDVGIRVSLEGLAEINDDLRGRRGCFDHGLQTILELRQQRMRDIGFGITVSDRNAKDLLNLYHLAEALKVEFATAVVHNSYYFHKHNNRIGVKADVIRCFEKLIDEMLRSWKPKQWYRAYFNYGLINYIRGNSRLLACAAGTDFFFLDPWGEVRPCNGMDSDSLDNSIGNLNAQSFTEIWHSARASRIRASVRSCRKECWMIGSVSPAMKRALLTTTLWVLKHKAHAFCGHHFMSP